MTSPPIRKSLARDERGTSIVELALFTPVLGTLILGAVDLAQGLSARHDLQQAADRSMELAMSRVATADPETGVVSYQFLREAAAEAADVPLANVTLTQWRECDGNVQSTYEDVCAPSQEVARYVRIRVASLYTPSFRYGPIAMSSAARPDGKVPIGAEAAVRVQ